MRLDQLTGTAEVQLFNLLRHAELPDFVKQASADLAGQADDLADSAFADPKSRQFPLGDPAQVYVSNAFFQAKKAGLAPDYAARLEERIKEAAALFSITAELEAYSASLQKQASAGPEESPVWVVEENGQERPLFPVKTAADLHLAVNEFAGNLPGYPVGWRRPIARGMLAKAAALGLEELPDIVCKYAGLFLPCSAAEVSHELRRRSRRAVTKEAGEHLARLADALADGVFEGREEVFKLAELVQRIEQQDGAPERPGSRLVLPDPVDIFFCHSPKQAAELLDVVKLGGGSFRMTDLRQVPASIYKEAFGIDIDPADSPTMREVLPTLPRSDAALFCELAGITPLT